MRARVRDEASIPSQPLPGHIIRSNKVTRILIYASVVLHSSLSESLSLFRLGDEDDGKTIRFGDKDQFITRTNDVIGAGSFGMVFHAIDTINGREVAAKVESMSEGTPLLPSESEAYAKIGEQS